MATSHNTRVQLQSQVIIDPSDLVGFTEEAMAMIRQNLRRPGVRIQCPGSNDDPGATTPTPHFMFGAKS